MFKVKVPVFRENSKTLGDAISGKQSPLMDCDVDNEFIFYRIDAIGAYIEENTEYCYIFSGGQSFISLLNVSMVEEEIEKAYKNLS